MARIREVAARGEMPGGDGAVAAAVEKAVRCLGRGVDMGGDLRLKHCKDVGGCLVLRSGEKKAAAAKVVVPGFGVAADVPADVKCGKGDRVRLKSGVLEFNKVSNTVPNACQFVIIGSDHLSHLSFHYRKIEVCLNLSCV